MRTTEPAHVRNVQAILQRVYDAGWIEKREYEGRYCVGCERFLTERDLVDGKCRDHEREPELRRETNYFFLMSRAFGWLREHYEQQPRDSCARSATATKRSRCCATNRASAISRSRGRSRASNGASSCPSTAITSATSGSTR